MRFPVSRPYPSERTRAPRLRRGTVRLAVLGRGRASMARPRRAHGYRRTAPSSDRSRRWVRPLRRGAVPLRVPPHHPVGQARHEGPTDIDNLALLCSTCHHRLHNNRRILTRSPDGTWGTAPDPRHTGRREPTTHSLAMPSTQPRTSASECPKVARPHRTVAWSGRTRRRRGSRREPGLISGADRTCNRGRASQPTRTARRG